MAQLKAALRALGEPLNGGAVNYCAQRVTLGSLASWGIDATEFKVVCADGERPCSRGTPWQVDLRVIEANVSAEIYASLAAMLDDARFMAQNWMLLHYGAATGLPCPARATLTEAWPAAEAVRARAEARGGAALAWWQPYADAVEMAERVASLRA